MMRYRQNNYMKKRLTDFEEAESTGAIGTLDGHPYKEPRSELRTGHLWSFGLQYAQAAEQIRVRSKEWMRTTDLALWFSPEDMNLTASGSLSTNSSDRPSPRSR